MMIESLNLNDLLGHLWLLSHSEAIRLFLVSKSKTICKTVKMGIESKQGKN